MSKEKNIKITDKDYEDFAALYPAMSRDQLTELISGDKYGVPFSEYADASLSPEKMKEIREGMTDRKKKNVALFECRYFTPASHPFASLFNVKEKLAEALINENIKGVSYKDIERFASSDGVLQGKSEKVYAAYAAGRDTVSGINKPDKVLPDKYAKIAESITVKENLLNTEIFFGLCGKCDVYKTFGKSGQDIVRGVTLDKDSSFAVRDKLCGYAESYYSVALSFADLDFALAVVPNTSAVKGNACVALTFADNTGIYIDSADKYFDTTPLVSGLKS